MHKRRLPPDNLLPGIILMLLVLLSLAVAGLVQFWDLAKATIGQAIGTLFAGCAAILGGLLAYRAAKLKVEQEERHRQEDLDARMVARHMQALRVCEGITGRLRSFFSQYRVDGAGPDAIKRAAEYNELGPTGGLIDLLRHCDEVDPEILGLLFLVYANLDHAQRTYNYIQANEVLYTQPWRREGKWVYEPHIALDMSLSKAFRNVVVAGMLAKAKLGRDYEARMAENAERARAKISAQDQQYFDPLPTKLDETKTQTAPPATKP